MQYLNWIQIPLITSNKKDQMFSERNYCKHISVYNVIFYQKVLQSFSWFIPVSKETRSLVFCWFRRHLYSPCSTKIKVVILKLVVFSDRRAMAITCNKLLQCHTSSKRICMCLEGLQIQHIVFILFFLFPGQICDLLTPLGYFLKKTVFSVCVLPWKRNTAVTQQCNYLIITFLSQYCDHTVQKLPKWMNIFHFRL